MHARSARNAATFSNNNLDHNDRILAAIAPLDSHERPNYGATTAQTISRSEATTEFRRVLNVAQDKVLLGHIGRVAGLCSFNSCNQL